MSVGSELQETTFDVWSFIRNARATQSASFSTLQKFVLSLEAQELRHIIEVYLKSKLGDHDSNGLTFKGSVDKLINKQTNGMREAVDASIMNNMQKKYGKKYNKKIIQIIQQNNTENKEHILSMNSQVFAYSFQYLSFKELCRILPTCSYFVYLDASYQGLSHCYIDLNQQYVVYSHTLFVMNMFFISQIFGESDAMSTPIGPSPAFQAYSDWPCIPRTQQLE